jgi:tRNA-dihydrouridine synthase
MDFKNLPRPFFALAPLDDVSDTVFRRVIAGCAPPDLFFTEFVNVDGLQSPGRPKLLKRLQFTPAERPLVAQIWGKKPENFYKTARQIADGTFAREFGLPAGVSFAGVDLNMGCPDKTVVKNGACSALINDRELAGEIIEATREGLGGELPLSVKTRLGFNEVDLTWLEFLLQRKLNMLTIHGRTRREMSKVPAHWEEIGKIRELRDRLAPDTLLVGNGDIPNRRHAPEQRIALYRKQVELFAATWQNRERPIQTLNKFCKIYINGFDGAKELRERLMRAESSAELLGILKSEIS